MREIVLDTETTGLDPEKGHRIIELGALEMINHVLTGKKLHLYINPERKIDVTAFQIHGISSNFLESKPKFKEVAKEIVNFIGNDKIIVHNAPFDIGFINYELESCKFNKFEMRQVTDTLILARKKFPGSPVNLDALCKRFDINLGKRKKHGALIDAELLSEVYIEILGGRQRELNILKNDKKNQTSSQKEQILEKDILSERNLVKLCVDDIKKHTQLLKGIKNPIWKKYLS